MTETLHDCTVTRHSDRTVTIKSPLVERYEGIEPTERKYQHGNTTLVKDRYRDVHAALRATHGGG